MNLFVLCMPTVCMAFVACSSQTVTQDISAEPGNTACELFYFLDPGTDKCKPCVSICITINVAGKGQTDNENNSLPSPLHVHMIVAQLLLGAIVLVAGIFFAMAAGVKMINYIRRQNAGHGNKPPIQETEPHAVSRFC